jgi:periplasmic protein TonB
MLTANTPMPALMAIAILVAHTPRPMTAHAASQSGVSTAQSSPEKPWPPAGVFRFQPGGDVIAPRLIKSARPDYSGDAMRAKIQGVVKLEAVVESDGTVGEVRVTRSLDRKFGLDDAAINSLKQYRFTPGTKNGVPVPVLLSFEVSFAVRK